MRTIKTTLLIFALLLALFGGSALAKGTPTLDRTFGNGGRAVAAQGISIQQGNELVATAPDGGFYAASEPRENDAVSAGPVAITRYLPNGAVDTSFGHAGSIEVTGPEGRPFRLSEILVDRAGRPYAVGTTWGPTEFFYPSYPLGYAGPAWATIERFTTAGALDQGYASGGVFKSTFDLPAESSLAATTVLGGPAAIDETGGIVLLVEQRVIEARVVHSAFHEVPKVLTRLTAAGAVDQSFGNGGTVPISALGASGLGLTSAGGVGLTLTPAAGEEGVFQLFALKASGAPDTSVGPAGLRSYAQIGGARDMAVAAGGAELVLGATAAPGPDAKYVEVKVMKLGAGGGPVAGFGTRGVAPLRLPPTTDLRHLVSDGRGGAYLLGAGVTTTSHDAAGRPRALVIHLTPAGKLDRGFGKDGLFAPALGHESRADGAHLLPGEELLVDGLGGPGSEVGNQVIAEYELASAGH
jgi:hypothetical protein